MESFKLDRNSFKAQTVEEAANHKTYYHQLSWQERLQVAAYLNSVAFNYPLNNPPKMDKNYFEAKALKQLFGRPKDLDDLQNIQ